VRFRDASGVRIDPKHAAAVRVPFFGLASADHHPGIVCTRQGDAAQFRFGHGRLRGAQDGLPRKFGIATG
jgi:hypothetical protein